MRLRLFTSLCLLTLGSVSAVATKPDCLLEFANASGAEGHDLVRSTYDRLLQALGSRLTPETLTKLAESEKPFDIPEQKDTDLDALRTHMKELERMAKERGWIDATATTQIADDLRNRARGQLQGKAEVDAKLDTTLIEKLLPFRAARQAEFTADGRYLVGVEGSRGRSQPGVPVRDFLQVYDLKTGTSFSLDGQESWLHGATPTPDGKRLLFANGNGRVFELPFANGVLDWKLGRFAGDTLPPLGQGQPTRSTREIVPAPDPNVAYAIVDGTAELFRYDLATGKRVPLHRRGEESFKLGSLMYGWGIVPGTDDLYVAANVMQSDFHRYRVAADGTVELVPAETRTFNASGLTTGTWSQDGRTLLAYNDFRSKRLLASTAPGAPPVDLTNQLPQFEDQGGIISVKYVPKLGDFLVLMQSNLQKSYVVRIDGKSYQRTGKVELDGTFTKLEVSPDGKWLSLPSDNDKLRLLNVENRFN